MENTIYCEILNPVLGIHSVSQQPKEEASFLIIAQQISVNI
jgi:hypothetical protein